MQKIKIKKRLWLTVKVLKRAVMTAWVKVSLSLLVSDQLVCTRKWTVLIT